MLRPPGRRCLLVDCDPAGGEWLLRPGVAPEPGLATLAMAGRRELAAGAALAHLQDLGDGLEVLHAPAAARQAASALEILGDRLGPHLRALGDLDVVADCGRLAQRSPALGVVSAADLVVLVSRPTAAEMVHLAPWVEQLLSEGRAVGVVLVCLPARGPHVSYGPAEVADALGVAVLGVLDHDAGAAARLWAQPGSLAGLGPSRLLRSASPVAAAVFTTAASAAALASAAMGGGVPDVEEVVRR